MLLLEEGVTPKAAGKEAWSVYPTFVVSDVGEAIEKAEQLGGGVKTYVSSFLSLWRFRCVGGFVTVCMLISTVPERRFQMVWV